MFFHIVKIIEVEKFFECDARALAKVLDGDHLRAFGPSLDQIVYCREGDIPPFSDASQIFCPFSSHISCILLIMASFNFIIVLLEGIHNYFMMIPKKSLVEFHDIEMFTKE